MTEQLKPCLRCGYDRVEIFDNRAIDSYSMYYALCLRCRLSGDRRKTAKAAVSFWNTRPIEDELRRQLAAQTEVVEAAKSFIEFVAYSEYWENVDLIRQALKDIGEKR